MSTAYIMDNKGRMPTLLLWERQARFVLGIQKTTVLDFIMGGNICPENEDPQAALEKLTENLIPGDVIITDGNKAGEDHLYLPLMAALDSLRTRGLTNIHFIFMSADIDRVLNFKSDTEEMRYSEDTDIHVYCCPVNELKACLTNEVKPRWIPPHASQENTRNASTVRTLFTENNQYRNNDSRNENGSNHHTPSPAPWINR